MGSKTLTAQAEAASIWIEPAFDHISASILSTVAYADIFDYPLTTTQIHRYLAGQTASKAEIATALADDRQVGCALSKKASFYTLRGREHLVDLRLRRAEVATRLWPRALRYGRAIAALPFVRMVAVTGALTMDNVEPDDDLDYLIITEPGRLWLARALVIGLVGKWAARHGDEICPNYLLSEKALVFEEHNLYTAHELAQMIPLSGQPLYQRMCRFNPWMARFLPNAQGPPKDVDMSEGRWRPARSLVETTLRTSVGARLERWERERKIRKFTHQIEDQATVSFSADRCKGHFYSHEHPVLTAFAERLQWLRELPC
jgi:hypothetical protein